MTTILQPGFDAYRESTIAYYKPQDVMEKFCVDQIIHGQWTLKRIARSEIAFLDHAIDEAIEGSAEEAPDQDKIISLVIAKLCTKDGRPKVFRRYRMQVQRRIQLAQSSFAKMRHEPEFSGPRIQPILIVDSQRAKTSGGMR